MQYKFKVKVYHADTDCYDVIWHGSYMRWMEAGRVEYFEMLGIPFSKLDGEGIIMPVAELNCRYKSPGRLFDELEISTELKEFNKASLVFEHEVANAKTGKILMQTTAKVVTADTNGKLLRKIPDFIRDKYNENLTNYNSVY